MTGGCRRAVQALEELFHREELLIEKRTKRKQLAQVDIAPMIRDIAFTQEKNLLRAFVTVQAQNPGLNPQLLEKAIARYLPELTPDFVRVRRRSCWTPPARCSDDPITRRASPLRVIFLPRR